MVMSHDTCPHKKKGQGSREEFVALQVYGDSVKFLNIVGSSHLHHPVRHAEDQTVRMISVQEL